MSEGLNDPSDPGDPDDPEGPDDPDDPEDPGGRVPDFIKDEELEHPRRKAIVEELKDRPGLNMNQLAEALGVSPSSIHHHILKLEKARVVVTYSPDERPETLCFRVEDADLWEIEETRILFGRRPNRWVGIFLAENPGTTTRSISEETGLSKVSVRYHLRTLAAYGLVHRHRAGGTFLYEPDDLLERWVEQVGEGFERPWEE